jgi:hypothetical protein
VTATLIKRIRVNKIASAALFVSSVYGLLAPFKCSATESSTTALNQASQASATGAVETTAGRQRNIKQLDYGRMRVFSAGIHRFEEDHLHPGREAVVAQDLSLVRILSQRGVPDDQIIALRDDEATTINCKTRLNDLLKRSQPGDFLFVFIHSHGSLNRGGLVCTYEKGGIWTYQELVQQIEDNFKGDRACICIAACHAGSLLNVIKTAHRKISYFAVTSVFPTLSAKTVATADFEACIKDVFGGAPGPDLNQDGVTTFAEFGRYISDDQRRLFHTVPEFGCTDNFDPEMVISVARPRSGPLDSALVDLPNGVKGRVVKQEGNRLLIRGSKNPRAVQWVRSENVERIR